jgi:hypothetical protein
VLAKQGLRLSVKDTVGPRGRAELVILLSCDCRRELPDRQLRLGRAHIVQEVFFSDIVYPIADVLSDFKQGQSDLL